MFVSEGTTVVFSGRREQEIKAITPAYRLSQQKLNRTFQGP
jgi:hypothetical protein